MNLFGGPPMAVGLDRDGLVRTMDPSRFALSIVLA